MRATYVVACAPCPGLGRDSVPAGLFHDGYPLRLSAHLFAARAGSSRPVPLTRTSEIGQPAGSRQCGACKMPHPRRPTDHCPGCLPGFGRERAPGHGTTRRTRIRAHTHPPTHPLGMFGAGSGTPRPSTRTSGDGPWAASKPWPSPSTERRRLTRIFPRYALAPRACPARGWRSSPKGVAGTRTVPGSGPRLVCGPSPDAPARSDTLARRCHALAVPLPQWNVSSASGTRHCGTASGFVSAQCSVMQGTFGSATALSACTKVGLHPASAPLLPPHMALKAALPCCRPQLS